MLLYYLINEMSNIRTRTDIFSTIAHQLSKNISTISDYSISTLAQICNVSTASLSRFAKLLDYRNFASFANNLEESRYNYQQNEGLLIHSETKLDITNSLFAQLEEINQLAFQTISKTDLKSIANSLLAANKVAILGGPTPQSAISLQMELNMNHVECTNYKHPDCQYREISELLENDFAIIYDTYAHDTITPYLLKLKAEKTKVLLISCQPHADMSYNPKYFINFPNTNLSMNLHIADIITLYLTAQIQVLTNR